MSDESPSLCGRRRPMRRVRKCAAWGGFPVNCLLAVKFGSRDGFALSALAAHAGGSLR
jgi:hypothetical protein